MNVASDGAIVMMTSCALSFQQFCCCITRTSGLTQVSLYDVVDVRFIDRREIEHSVRYFSATGVVRTGWPVPDRRD